MEVIFGNRILEELKDAFILSEGAIFIVSPYLSDIKFRTRDGAKDLGTIRDLISWNSVEDDSRYIFITDFEKVGQHHWSNEYIRKIKKDVFFPNLFFFHIPKLHTKLYLFRTRAFVGSFNFTDRGVNINHEIGLLIIDDTTLRSLREYVGFLLKKATPINVKARMLSKDLSFSELDQNQVYEEVITWFDEKGWQPSMRRRGDNIGV